MSKPVLTMAMHRVGPAAFRAVSGTGGELIVDGSPDIGGEGRGMRPMELLLTAIASCASMDVVHILRKQGEPLADLEVHAEGDRKDATPAPFTAVRLRFVAHAEPGARALDLHKVQRAVGLGVEKYCSVASSLDPAIRVTWTAELA
jgi:putative redox protein